MKRGLIFPALLLALWALAAPPALAQDGGGSDRIGYGGEVVIQPGETVRDAVSFGGNVFVSQGAVVRRDVVSLGGNVTVLGEVGRNVTSVGGDVSLRETAVVHGDVTTVGGVTHLAQGARVDGQILQGFRGGYTGPGRAASVYENPLLSFVFGLLQSFLAVMVASAVSALAVLFLPRHMQTVRNAAERQPILSPSVGCLTLVFAPIALVLGTLCLLVPGLLLLLLLVLALIVGWIALGLFLGERILAALRVTRRGPEYEIVAAALGTAVISALTTFPNIVPCIGKLFTMAVGLVLASWGLGAVVLTRFGTRAYLPPGPGPAGPPYPAPPVPLAPPASPPARREPPLA